MYDQYRDAISVLATFERLFNETHYGCHACVSGPRATAKDGGREEEVDRHCTLDALDLLSTFELG